MPDIKKETNGELEVMDRISELSDDILHHIISFMGSKDAGRTSVLSKRWTHIWYTAHDENFDGDEVLERFTKFVEKTLIRENVSFRDVKLKHLTIDMADKIDGWLEIIVKKQVKALTLTTNALASGAYFYSLPAVLFTAKSLSSIKLCRVRLKICRDLQLVSLHSLKLSEVDVDEGTLQHIIISCPLRNLKLKRCFGFQKVLIPQESNLEFLDVCECLPISGKLVVETSKLRILNYSGSQECKAWLFTLTSFSMKNLTELRIQFVVIGKNVLERLIANLLAIGIMWFSDCPLPKDMRVSSKTLKELGICDCVDVRNFEIDAPKLDFFSFTGDLGLSSVISIHGDAYLHLRIWIRTREFLNLRMLISNVDHCKVLGIYVNGNSSEFEFDQDQVGEIIDGMSPYVPELKLTLFFYICPEPSRMAALVDGLLWSCRPEILSLFVPSDSDNRIVKCFLEAVEEKVTCRNHPLKRITEVEATNCDLFSYQEDDLQLRLYW